MNSMIDFTGWQFFCRVADYGGRKGQTAALASAWVSASSIGRSLEALDKLVKAIVFILLML